MNSLKTSINLTRSMGVSILLIGLTLVPLLTANVSKAHAATTLPTYNYTRTFDATNGSAEADYVATDKNNNVYVYGYFSGTMIFNPSDPSTTITSPNDNIFLTKYSSSGVYQWTKTLDVAGGAAYATGITTDSSGNVIMYGSLNGTVSLPGINGFSETTQNTNIIPPSSAFTNQNRPGGLHPNITSPGYTSFLVKFDTNGSTLWSNVADSGNNGQIFSYNIAIDKNNNLFTTGYFCGAVNFVNITTSTSMNCSSYVAKYNNEGVFQDIKYNDTSIAGAYGSFSLGNGVTADKNGNTYVTGYFMGQVGFNYDGDNTGTDILTNPYNGSEGFITKYNSDGSYAWTRINTIQNNQSGDDEINIAADSDGNVYTNGGFVGPISFNQTNTQISADNGINYSNYLTKYDTNGNYKWTNITTNQVGSSSGDSFLYGGLVIDPNNDIFVSGQFEGNVILDGPNGTDHYTSSNDGARSGYFSKFNPDGSYGYSKVSSYEPSAAGGPYVRPNSLAVDNLGNLYSTGVYKGAVYFNGIDNTDENNSESYNAFLTSWKAFIPPVTLAPAKTPSTPSTGFAKGNNTNQIILYSSLFIALSLITGGYVVNKRDKN